MNFWRLLRWTAVTFAGLVAVLIAASAVVVILGMRLDLSMLRGPVESAVTRTLGREVEIQGPIRLEPTLWPTVEVTGLRVANLENWQPADFARLDLARLQLGLLPLLTGEIRIREITVKGMALALESTQDGQNNWTFKTPAGPVEPAEPTPEVEEEVAAPEFVALEQLNVRDVAITYRDGGLGRSYEFRLDQLLAGAPAGEPIRAEFGGSYEQVPYAFSLNGQSFADLLDPTLEWALEITGEVAGSPIEITGSLLPEGADDEAKLEVLTQRIDIGALLKWLEVAENEEARVERMGIRIIARGDGLYQLLERSDFLFGLKGGYWTVRDPATQATARIQIVEGRVSASPEQPSTLRLDGRLDETPVNIEIQTERLIAFAVPPERLGMKLTADAAGARLAIEAGVALPIGRETGDLSLSFSGERLDTLDELLGLALPPLGPYSLGGRLDIVENGYRLSDFVVRVGESDLTGNFSLDLKARPARFDIALATDTLQINDFDVGDWSAVDAAPGETETGEQVEATESSEADQPDILLSPEVMGLAEGRLAVTVGEVRSGKDKLGSGSLTATLEKGRFSLAPLVLSIPGGSLELSSAYEPSGTHVAAEISARIERLDYGILARRVTPETDMAGWLSLNMDIESRAESHQTILHHANGHLDFAIWPENFEAGIFDLWAVNLMTAIMPKLDSQPASVVNCAVARFALKDGHLTQDAILIDTSQMQVTGEVEVDFESETVDMVLASKAKKAQIFSLETPIEVEGKFSDFGVGTPPGAIFGTTVRFITSPIHVPFRRLFADAVPADGQAACASAMHRRAR